MTDIEIRVVDRIDLVVAPRPWAFAEQRRADITAHFAERRRKTPELWNGRILMLGEWQTQGTTWHGTCFEAAFADFVAWHDWGYPDRTVASCFGMGALRGADGAFLLGVMAAHTFNAGRIYFPAGTPDPSDVVDGRLDLAGSVLREVAEETGLGTDDFAVAPGWGAVLAGANIAMMRILTAHQPAVVLRERILAHLARERQPELADIRIVRAPCDLDPMMPDFVAAYLSWVWG